VIRLAKKVGLEIHLSTQASVANSKAALFYKSQGVRRIVLARECTLEQIKKIKRIVSLPSVPLSGAPPLGQGRKSGLELETFVHGAMCVSVSGRCFMSQYLYGKSANRGECLQPCRRKYLIKQIDGKEELELGEDYVLSPKDLCTLPFIEKLIEAGIDCFKIEGRNRSAEYVRTVTNIYRKAIDFYQKNKKAIKQRNKKAIKQKNKKAIKQKNKEVIGEFEDIKKQGMEELKKVYNRGFGNGFYLGKPISEWTHSYGSQATEKKIHIGKVNHFYGEIKVAEILIQAKKIVKVGDILQIEGPKTGVLRQKIDSMEIEHKKVKRAGQKDLWAVKLNKQVKANDKVYKIVN